MNFKFLKEDYNKDLDNVSKAIEEMFRLTETPHFQGKDHLLRHYDLHVLKPGEQFNPEDPKFPSTMTLEDYVKAAEELADEPAVQMFDFEDGRGNTKDCVVGWVLYHKNKNAPKGKRDTASNRIIKIRTRSKFVPGFFDVVTYVDNVKDNQIFSFMCGKPRNLRNWEEEYQYDLYSQGGPDPLYEKKTLKSG